MEHKDRLEILIKMYQSILNVSHRDAKCAIMHTDVGTDVANGDCIYMKHLPTSNLEMVIQELNLTDRVSLQDIEDAYRHVSAYA